MLSVKISLDYYKNPIGLLKSFALSLSLKNYRLQNLIYVY